MLTIPTLCAILSNEPGYDLVCHRSYHHCNYDKAWAATILIAVFTSALWHLVLLIPALSRNRFIRWHGRQALLLAGVRTLIPLVFGLAFYDSGYDLLFIPLNFIIWLAGNLIGQNQARQGDCWLARVFSRGSELPGPPEPPKVEDVEVF
jgi:hypothetical protein